uniref:Endothelin-converting enzyme n=1 Tax=Rhipicephalus zambeziensis TaxID=60191 RepID=A0A224YC97_9ACAR
MRVFGRRPSVVTLKDDDNSTSRTRLGGSSPDDHLQPSVVTITRSYRRFLPVISGPFAAFSELQRRHPSLLPCVMCMAVACGGLALAMVLMRQQVKLDATLLSSANVCGTKDCREQAARIAMNIDAKRDPCQDLYAYTCGGAKASDSKGSLMSSYVESVKGFIQRGLVPEERNSSGAAYKAYSAFNACLSRSAGVVDAAKPFAEFMSARKIPWPSSAPLDADPLDVLVDLAVNWRVPLLFDVRLLYTERENPLVVTIEHVGDVALLRMEQLSASDLSVGEYDNLLRSVAGYLRQGALLSDEDCRQLRQDEGAVRNNVTLIARSEEQEEVDVFVASVNDSVLEMGPTWLTLLRRHLGRDVELSPSTKLLAHSGRHFHAVLTLLASVPRERLLNVIGWTFAYSYLWLVNPDSDHFQPGKESDVFDVQVACFLAVQESYGTLLVAPQFLAYFHQQANRQRLFDLWNETTQAFVRAVLASRSLANATKHWAVEKILQRTRRQLWPPEPFFHAELLDELYEGFPAAMTTSSGLFKSLFESRRAARRILRNSYYGRLLTGSVRWPEKEVRYWYGGDLLRVGLSALFPPSYYRDDAGVSAYSGLGFQIARALVRTVDERGRTDGTAKDEWKQVAKCRLDSANTSLERDAVARLFALDVALAALRSNAQNRLDGLEGLEKLTGLQTFYVNFCGKFCGHRRGSELCNVAMNASEFGDAFECPAAPSARKDRRCLVV